MKTKWRNLLWDSAMSLFFVSVAFAIQPGHPGEDLGETVIKANGPAVRSVPAPLSLPIHEKVRSNAKERSEMRPRPSLH